MNASEQPSARRTLGQGARLLVDVGPIAVFMVAYNVANRMQPDQALFIATGVFMASTAAALAYAWLVERRLPAMLMVSGVLVLVFGGLTLWLHDGLFIKIKPTIVNLFYAAVIFGGLLVRVNVWKLLFGSIWTLSDGAWTTLAVRWGLFFIFLAALNEYVWRSYSEVFWANFKFWGVLPLTVVFSLLQIPLVVKDEKAQKARLAADDGGRAEAAGMPPAG